MNHHPSKGHTEAGCAKKFPTAMRTIAMMYSLSDFKGFAPAADPVTFFNLRAGFDLLLRFSGNSDGSGDMGWR